MAYGIEALAAHRGPTARSGRGRGLPASAATPAGTLSTLPASDAELMVLIQAGDAAAFEPFYDRHVAVALRVATRILRDPDLAEDAVQDGFIGFWRSRMSYRPGAAPVSTWLLTIVSNRAIDICRRERKHGDTLTKAAPRERCPERDSTEEAALAHADQRELRAQLSRLPSEQRRVIELAYFGGLTHGEIARELRLPLGTVKGRLRLGCDKLRVAAAPTLARTG
jgi:RNA polymerase sigma-70 factor (ECF subfamily)